MNSNIVAELVALADLLDKRGLKKEADKIDTILVMASYKISWGDEELPDADRINLRWADANFEEYRLSVEKEQGTRYSWKIHFRDRRSGEGVLARGEEANISAAKAAAEKKVKELVEADKQA